VKLSGKAALYMALVFASGAVLGVVGNRSYTAYYAANNNTKVRRDKDRRPPTPKEYREGYISFMQKRLNLSSDQVTQIGLIFDETRAQFEELQQRTIPEQMSIGNGQTERIRAILSDEQREQFELLRKEREDRNKRKGNNRGGFRGPGF